MVLAAPQEGLEHLEAHRVVVYGEDPHADGELVPPPRRHASHLLRPHGNNFFQNTLPNSSQSATRNRPKNRLLYSQKYQQRQLREARTEIWTEDKLLVAPVSNQETVNPKLCRLKEQVARRERKMWTGEVAWAPPNRPARKGKERKPTTQLRLKRERRRGRRRRSSWWIWTGAWMDGARGPNAPPPASLLRQRCGKAKGAELETPKRDGVKKAGAKMATALR